MFKFLLYKIAKKIALILPLKFAYRLAIFLADLHRLFSPADRIAVRSNLEVIFPGIDRKKLKIYMRDIFRNFAKYLVDFFRFPIIDKDYIKKNVDIVNLDIVDQALAKGKGVIAVTAHIANWELSGVTMAILGYPIAAVALSHQYGPTNRFFIEQRECKGIKIIPFGKAAFQCIEALKKNQILALVGDRDFGQSGIMMDFLGKPTLIPKGPAAFSLKYGVPLVVGIMIRKDNDKFRLIYEGPLEIETCGDKEKDLVNLTKKYVSIFERYIREYPQQWLIFRKFWEPLDIRQL
jgi:KDO2-lipid IV(A) lauroyltransferase